MTLTEMQACAAETLSFFMQTMPDVPFAEDDVIIEFTPRAKMAERAKALCALYVPDKTLNDSQTEQLTHSIAANALIGREKSAVIVRINYRDDKQNLRQILYHEFMHIFCAKSEMEGEHFIDIYGSGHTPDMNPENKEYDGYLNAGYVVWSEFIAQYYALLKTEPKPYTFSDIMEYAFALLGDVSIASDNDDSAKQSFAMACAYLLTCDNGNILSDLVEPEGIDSGRKQTQMALRACLEHLHKQLQTEKPWKITEEFISDFGSMFIMFKVRNSFNIA